jgi:hypothetical protein
MENAKGKGRKTKDRGKIVWAYHGRRKNIGLCGFRTEMYVLCIDLGCLINSVSGPAVQPGLKCDGHGKPTRAGNII